MWKGRSGGKGNNVGLVVVAVDADRGSQHALKWAADHLVARGQSFHLLHVRKKIASISTPTGQQLPIAEVDEDVAAAYFHQRDRQTRELLLPFQCFCNRRGLQCKEVVLDETDVPKAIIDYVVHQSVDKLVLGASSRNAFTRTFKHADVPTSVSRLAPDFCTIYVIAKGKISSIRPAPRPNKNSVNRQSILNSEATGNPYQSAKSDPVARHPVEELSRMNEVSQGAGRHDFSFQSVTSCPSPINNGTDQTFGFSFQSASSCPSPSRSVTHQPFGFSVHERPDSGNWPLKMAQTRNECLYDDGMIKNNDPRRSSGTNWSNSSGSSSYESHGSELSRSCDYRGFGGANWSASSSSSSFLSHGSDRTRNYDTGRFGGANWSNSLGSSSYEACRYQRPPPLSQEADGSDWSTNSVEEMEADMRQLKIKMKQKKDFYSSTSVEAVNAKQKAKENNSSMTAAKQSREELGHDNLDGLEKTRYSGSDKMLSEKNLKFSDFLPASVKYRRYTLEEIENATDKFSDALKIGEGGYGPVYKSNLDHTLVAIKILRSDVTQGMKQFLQEVEVLSAIRHPNLVLLLGACPEYGCLVYEYLSNGSLEDRLFCRNNTPPLSWQLRFKIAAEIATGLLFLHQNKPDPLVHRDLKPSNILLDHNFGSKIADVGLSRLVPTSAADAVTQYRMTAAAGTFCYIDPEYQKTGLLGIKSDIYAFGIILMQLLTSKPPMGLAHSMESAMESGRLEEMMDTSIQDWPMEETIKFGRLALRCAELRRRDRPDLGTILPELNRFKRLADESQPSLKHIQHTNIRHHQDAISVPSLPILGFNSLSGLEKAYPASMIMPPASGSSLLR